MFGGEGVGDVCSVLQTLALVIIIKTIAKYLLK